MHYKVSSVSRYHQSSTRTTTKESLFKISSIISADSKSSSVGLLLLLDVSDSMRENNALDAIKKSIAEDILHQIPEGIAFAAVEFAEDARIVFEYSSFTATDRLEARERVLSVRARFTTNLHAGLDLAQKVRAKYHQRDWHMMVLTDGEATSGPYKKVVLPTKEAYTSCTRWQPEDAPEKLASMTASFKTHVHMFQVNAFLEFGECVMRMGKDNCAYFAKSQEELVSQLQSTIPKLSRGNRRVKIRVQEHGSEEWTERLTSVAELEEGEFCMLVYNVSKPLLLMDFMCDDELTIVFAENSVKDLSYDSLTDEEKAKTDHEFAQTKAYEKLCSINNCLLRHRDEKLCSSVGGDWVKDTDFEFVEMEEQLNNLMDVGGNTATYRSLCNRVDKLKCVFTHISGFQAFEKDMQSLKQQLPEPPIEKRIPELLIATSSDILSQPNHEKTPDGNNAAREGSYRSLGGGGIARYQETTTYTPDFEARLSCVVATRREVIEQNNKRAREYTNDNLELTTKIKALQKKMDNSHQHGAFEIVCMKPM